MRLDYNSGSTKISKYWIDFQFFYDLYYRINFIWKKDNVYKKKNKYTKKNKIQKYEYILQNIILDKENKNIYPSSDINSLQDKSAISSNSTINTSNANNSNIINEYAINDK